MLTTQTALLPVGITSCRGKVEMSPIWQSRNVVLPLVPRVPIPSCQDWGCSACGGFRQGRAPVLRAPQGSLDGFRGKQHNASKREWERSL